MRRSFSGWGGGGGGLGGKLPAGCTSSNSIVPKPSTTRPTMMVIAIWSVMMVELVIIIKGDIGHTQMSLSFCLCLSRFICINSKQGMLNLYAQEHFSEYSSDGVFCMLLVSYCAHVHQTR